MCIHFHRYKTKEWFYAYWTDPWHFCRGWWEEKYCECGKRILPDFVKYPEMHEYLSLDTTDIVLNLTFGQQKELAKTLKEFKQYLERS